MFGTPVAAGVWQIGKSGPANGSDMSAVVAFLLSRWTQRALRHFPLRVCEAPFSKLGLVFHPKLLPSHLHR